MPKTKAEALDALKEAAVAFYNAPKGQLRLTRVKLEYAAADYALSVRT